MIIVKWLKGINLKVLLSFLKLLVGKGTDFAIGIASDIQREHPDWDKDQKRKEWFRRVRARRDEAVKKGIDETKLASDHALSLILETSLAVAKKKLADLFP